jgi:hypothetical protein
MSVHELLVSHALESPQVFGGRGPLCCEGRWPGLLPDEPVGHAEAA